MAKKPKEEKPAVEGGEEAAPKKKKGLLKWIILAVLLLLLGGGGYFAYLKFLAPKPADEQSAPAEEHKEEKKEDKHEDKKEDKKKEGESKKEGEGKKETEKKGFKDLVTVPPFVVNLADPQARRFLKLAMDVEVVDEQASKDFAASMSKVRDSILLLLSSKTSEELSKMEGKIMLRKEIVERLNQALGGQKVLRIYITDMVIQ